MRPTLRRARMIGVLLGLGAGPAGAEDVPGIRWPEPNGDLTIARAFGRSEIALRLTSRHAGAVDSLSWEGVEFVNRFDHGRALQSSASLDGYGECLNPTEAGSHADGFKPTSTSLLLSLRHGRAWAETETAMAYWLVPGSIEGHCPRGLGTYREARSDIVLKKRIAIGLPGVPNAIEVQAGFVLPRPVRSAAFEVLTGYMPAEFSRFWTFDPASQALAPLSDGPGEQGLPVILATPDGGHAMGVWSPGLPQAGRAGSGYGRWNFTHLPGRDNATVKWNCVFREDALPAGQRDYTCYALVGSLADVRAGLIALTAPR